MVSIESKRQKEPPQDINRSPNDSFTRDLFVPSPSTCSNIPFTEAPKPANFRSLLPQNSLVQASDDSDGRSNDDALVASRNAVLDPGLCEFGGRAKVRQVPAVDEPHDEHLGQVEAEGIVLRGRVRAAAVLGVAVLGLEGEVEEVGGGEGQEDAGDEPQAERGPELGREHHEQVVALDGELGHAHRVDGRHHEQRLPRQELIQEAQRLDQHGYALDRRRAADVAAHRVQVLGHARRLVGLVHPLAHLSRVAVDLAGHFGWRGRERHVGREQALCRRLGSQRLARRLLYGCDGV